MRFAVIMLCSIALAGCGSNPDIGNPFVNAINAFTSGLGAQDSLEVDLLKDFARKSTQLRYISLDTYSCGDPNDPFIVQAERNYRSSHGRNKPNAYTVLIEARKNARSSDALISALVAYGKVISDLAKTYKDAETTLNNAQSVVDAFKKASILPEAVAMISGLDQVIKIAKAARDYNVENSIRAAAVRMRAPLRTTTKALKDSKRLVALTAHEALAFNYWDACARERIKFIRDFFPSILASAEQKEAFLRAQVEGRANASDLNGMTRTSVLDIAREVGIYLAEREAFIGRRPDYISLLVEIEKANDKLTTLTGNDLLVAAANFVNMTDTIGKSTEALRSLSR